MKKKQINLGKKLLLNKDTIASMAEDQQGQILGGSNNHFNTCICNKTVDGNYCYVTQMNCPPSVVKCLEPVTTTKPSIPNIC